VKTGKTSNAACHIRERATLGSRVLTNLRSSYLSRMKAVFCVCGEAGCGFALCTPIGSCCSLRHRTCFHIKFKTRQYMHYACINAIQHRGASDSQKLLFTLHFNFAQTGTSPLWGTGDGEAYKADSLSLVAANGSLV
jgi:hypothetical protein